MPTALSAVTASAVRLAELLASGAVHVTTDLAPSLFGFHATAYLWLTVTPGDLHQTGQTLSLHPETTFTAAITHLRTIHLAVAGGVHTGRADGLRRRALRLREWVGYPVAESQQAGSGQCYRQGAPPPDGVG